MPSQSPGERVANSVVDSLELQLKYDPEPTPHKIAVALDTVRNKLPDIVALHEQHAVAGEVDRLVAEYLSRLPPGPNHTQAYLLGFARFVRTFLREQQEPVCTIAVLPSSNKAKHWLTLLTAKDAP